MAIEKLSEFAKDGQKNTDDLNLTDGFSVSKKPARQWFNWLFNSLTTKVNEIIDADFVPKADIVDNLTTNDAKKPVSAKQAKNLQDSKLDKTANAASSTRLETPINIALSGAVSGNANFDGSGNIDIAAVLNNFGGLKESNGYKYLGDGTLIQWVRLNKIIGQYSGEYNFPIAFPNVCFGVSISNSWYVSQSGNGYQLRAGVKSNTVFGIGEDNFNGQGVGNMSQAFVIAIGC